MNVLLSHDDLKLYSKLYVSGVDLKFAQYCARVLQKNGWHSRPWERRGTVYQQQTAFTTALITSYSRPFTRSRGWPKLPSDLIAYNPQEMALHHHLMRLRNTTYAHSDSGTYSIRPFRAGNLTMDIVNAPTLRITSEEAALFQVMTEKLLITIGAKMKELAAQVR